MRTKKERHRNKIQNKTQKTDVGSEEECEGGGGGRNSIEDGAKKGGFSVLEGKSILIFELSTSCQRTAAQRFAAR